MNKTKQSFKNLVQECLTEVKEERSKRKELKEALRKYVRTVLNEVISGPDQVDQEEDEEEKINKGYDKDGNKPSEETQDQQVQEISKLVHGIDPDYNVYRDTRGPGGKRSYIVIDAGELFTVLINERWQNNFDITAMVRMKDRVKAIGLNWEQVKAFVKANFSEVAKSYVQKAKEKVDGNREDQTDKRDSELPDTSIKTKKISNEPAKMGDEEAEDMVKKDEDQPSAPMKQVTKPGKDPESMNKAKDQKTTPQAKPPKHDNDKELVKKMPGKKRDK